MIFDKTDKVRLNCHGTYEQVPTQIFHSQERLPHMLRTSGQTDISYGESEGRDSRRGRKNILEKKRTPEGGADE